MLKIMADKYSPPPKGYVINDPDYGTISIGKDSKVNRPRQIQISSASLAALRLFEDGGFELRSNAGGKKQKPDNILSQSKLGLHIRSTGDEIVIDAGSGTIRLTARDIILEATGSDAGGVSILSNNNINIDAADNIGIEGSQVAIGAKYKMFIGTGGPFILRGKGGVSIVEPKNKLIPTTISEVTDKVLSFVFPEYF